MKKTLALLLISILVIFSLISCGGDTPCTEHVDADANGKCDNCDATVEPQGGDEGNGGDAGSDVVLVKDGDALFSVLVASSASSVIRDYANGLIQELNKYYIEDKDVIASYDNAELDPGAEIIIGPVTSRGEKFNVDVHYLGYEGFAIKAIDGKIFVIAGGNTGYRKAMDYLKKSVLKLDDYDDYIANLSIAGDMNHEVIQSGYDIESIKINSNDLKDYVITYSETLRTEKNVANALQESLYKGTGIWLDIVRLNKLKDGQKAIYIEYTGDDESRTTDEGLVVYVDEDSNMHVECEFSDIFDEKTEEIITSVLMPKNKKNVTLSTGTVRATNVRDIFYDSFGAAGDGVTNDFEAIKACHEHANKYGYTANATAGKTYYIGATEGKSIPVCTNVKWNGASFIIDDLAFSKDAADRNASIFVIKSDATINTYRPGDRTPIGQIIADINAAGGIDAETCAKLDLGLGFPALLVVYNDNHENYIRYGSHYEGGSAQHEIISVDENGNIDLGTRFMYDYTEITRIEVRRIDDKAITINGGGATFTTIANQVPFEWNGSSPVYYYYKRNISIERSNAIFENVTHLISGELVDCGAPYSGFITVAYANNVLVRDCIVTGHRNYNNMGSYDLAPGNSNNITFLNVVQSNFFLEDGTTVSSNAGYWGIMGSNYCKNLTYDTCILTRFDAHMGVYNATIRNSSVNTISLIGMGTFTMENTKVYAATRANLITLRSDYGSTWSGDFVLKDVKVVYTGDSSQFTIINGTWNNHYFGYACEAPKTVTLDGFVVESTTVNSIQLANGTITNPNISGDMIGTNKNDNPYATTEQLIIKNNTKNYTFSVPSTYNTEIIYE